MACNLGFLPSLDCSSGIICVHGPAWLVVGSQCVGTSGWAPGWSLLLTLVPLARFPHSVGPLRCNPVHLEQPPPSLASSTTARLVLCLCLLLGDLVLVAGWPLPQCLHVSRHGLWLNFFTVTDGAVPSIDPAVLRHDLLAWLEAVMGRPWHQVCIQLFQRWGKGREPGWWCPPGDQLQ